MKFPYRSRLAWLTLLAIGVLVSPATAQDVVKRQLGEMVLEDVPEWDPALRERMLQYLNVRAAAIQSLADDGKSMLINTRFGDTAQTHLVTMPLGMRKQLTFFDEPIAGAGFMPGSGGKQVIYLKGRGGDERNQFYVLDLETGTHSLLTDGKSRTAGPAFSKSGRWMAFSSTARNDKDFDVYLVDMNTIRKGATYASSEEIAKNTKMIWQVDGQYYAGEFNPEETKFIAMKYISEKETQYYIVDVASGKATPLTPTDKALFYGGATWSKDGKAVYLYSDRDGEFRKLYKLDLASNRWDCLTTDLNWDIEEIAVDPASGGIAFTSNEDGASKLYFADANGQSRKAVTGLAPSAVIGGLTFNKAGGTLGFTVNSATSPADAYTTAFPQAQQITRWTQSEVGGLNTSRFIEPQLIRYPTFDQVDGKPRQIPAYLFRGRGEGKRPVVISVHGGPEAQYLPTFSSTIQFWTGELGITVIAPNVRGSTGYGRTYHQLDNAVKREDSIKDIGALLDWIATQPDLDSSRVAIYGGSYGGYMVLASLTTYVDRFKAGIDIVGPASLVTFLENTPEFRRDLRRAEYGDERIPEVRKVLEAVSPLNKADQIKAALFVAHGKNDPRVPFTEAEQIVKKMREMKRSVWYALALNEGHGFGKKANSDLAAVMYAHFWKEHLLK